jgi:hypothetical protein
VLNGLVSKTIPFFGYCQLIDKKKVNKKRDVCPNLSTELGWKFVNK